MPGITSIDLAQPPLLCMNTQCPAVITVRGPTNQPVPIQRVPLAAVIRRAQMADQGYTVVLKILTRSSCYQRGR